MCFRSASISERPIRGVLLKPWDVRRGVCVTILGAGTSVALAHRQSAFKAWPVMSPRPRVHNESHQPRSRCCERIPSSGQHAPRRHTNAQNPTAFGEFRSRVTDRGSVDAMAPKTVACVSTRRCRHKLLCAPFDYRREFDIDTEHTRPIAHPLEPVIARWVEVKSSPVSD